MSDLIPDIQLQDNTDQRLACVLVLDGSTSMMEKNDDGQSRIDLLNEGLKTFENELKNLSDSIIWKKINILNKYFPNVIIYIIIQTKLITIF